MFALFEVTLKYIYIPVAYIQYFKESCDFSSCICFLRDIIFNKILFYIISCKMWDIIFSGILFYIISRTIVPPSFTQKTTGLIESSFNYYWTADYESAGLYFCMRAKHIIGHFKGFFMEIKKVKISRKNPDKWTIICFAQIKK